IMESLKWLGLDWDEGPTVEGPNSPYLQSKRLDLYKKYAQILIDKGLAYPDPYTEQQVEEFRKKAEEEKRAFLYREHRPETFDVWDGTKPLRFKIPEVKSYHWHDVVFGDLSAGPEALDDFIMIKSDGYPTYNFAHIVDDTEMGITLVMRGQEYVSSTPKFLAVYEALGITPPTYACLPHVLAPGGQKKLGKRDGAKDVLDYRKEGYLPEAIVNFLAFLGWNPGGEKEIFTREELIEIFDISRIQVSGAQMNLEKLEWMNKEHIKLLPHEEVEKNILEWLPEGMKNSKLVPVIVDRISKWSDVKTMAEAGELDLFFKALDYSKEKLIFKNTPAEKINENIKLALTELEKIPEEDFNLEHIKTTLMSIADTLPSRGELLHPVRYALSGLDKSPDPFLIASILGKNESISRLQKATS
ncbi:MAG: glutamate--tRNA ligase, partial [Candidatus Nomurabacteria bacterium]|nr:glutamate--tRNA ligase [Candidatus Nomurabacteria bacterium]